MRKAGNKDGRNVREMIRATCRSSIVLSTNLLCFYAKFPPPSLLLTPSSCFLAKPSSYSSPSKKMEGEAAAAIIHDCFCFQEETHFTVCKTSLFYTGDGFSVYDSKGLLVFRVDSYGPETQHQDEIVLMDSTGKCLLTVHKKRPSLHQRWEGFLGERKEGQKPIFSIRRSSIIKRSSVTVEMYNDLDEEYEIYGSFAQRSSTFYKTCQKCRAQVVAEIKRKVDTTTNVLLGKDVFSLCIKPGFDSAFVMGLVLVLDQIGGDYDEQQEQDEAVASNVESMSI